MKRIILTIACLLAGTAQAGMPVEIEANAQDMAGSRLVYAIKERLRASSTMEQTFVQSKMRLKLNIVTMDRGLESTGLATIYSAAIVLSIPDQTDMFLTHYVGDCGINRLAGCADYIIAGMDAQLDSLKKIVPTLAKF